MLPVSSQGLRFGLINGQSEFFLPLAQGFTERCTELGIETIHRSNLFVKDNETATIDASEHYRELLDIEFEEMIDGNGTIEGPVDAIAFEPSKEVDHVLVELVQEAYDRGIPSVTIDRDIDNSTRVAYVGTNQQFMGATMARSLRQLRPEGGVYALVNGKVERDEGFVNEISRYTDTNGKPLWKLLNYTYETREERDEKCVDYFNFRECYMEMYAEANVDAMIFMRQSKFERIAYFTRNQRVCMCIHT